MAGPLWEYWRCVFRDNSQRPELLFLIRICFNSDIMMDFDEIVVKESPGLCRCCLSEGCYKDLGSEYSWMSDTEIYADMLLECFDISVSVYLSICVLISLPKTTTSI